jgi:hypothetical protein
MKFKFFIILLLFVLPSCREKKDIPPGILPENQFISLLVDIHIADASLNILQIKDVKFKFNADDYYYSVLKKHNTDKKTFDNSLQYYSKDLVKLNKIYDEVLKRLSIIEGNLNKKPVNDKLPTGKERY